MKKWSILYLVLFKLLAVGAHGQSVEQLITYADYKFETGSFELAAREYQRALFFGSKENVGVLNIKTGDCYFSMRRYREAEKYYRFASSIVENDSIKAESVLRKSSCEILTGNYRLGIFDLLNLNIQNYPKLEVRKSFLLGIAYFGVGEYRAASANLNRIILGEDPLFKEKLEKLLHSKNLNRPNPVLAYWMSIFLPGSGQFYAGDIKNGANSLLLTASIVAIGFRIALVQSPWDAFFTVFPWFQRYHNGGFNSAKRIAEQKRAQNRAEVYHEIYNLVIPRLQ